MLSFLKDLLPCLLLGFWLGRRYAGLPGQLAPPLVRYGVPLSVMGLLLQGGLSPQVLLAAVIASGAIASVLLGSSVLPWGRQWLKGPCGRLGSCVGNTAYFGIPAALAFLPPVALPISIGYDLGATLLMWSLGPLLMAGDFPMGAGLLRRLWQGLSNSPAFRGLIGALLIQVTPWQESLTQVLWWPSRVVILLALALVGMRLGVLSLRAVGTSIRWSDLLPVLVGKLLAFPLLVLLIGLILRLDPLLMQALTLQAAAPTAISVLLIAEAVDCDQELAASMVMWSTLMALITCPLWGYALVLVFNTTN